ILSAIFAVRCVASMLRCRSMALAPRRIGIEGLLRPCAIPRIPVASLLRQFTHIIVDRLVAIAEDRQAGRDAVIARPERSRSCFRFKMASRRIAAPTHPFLPHNGSTLQPRNTSIDCRNYCRRWMRQLHQVDQDTGALTRRQGCRLIVPSGDWSQCQGIVLLSPCCALTFYDDLGRQNALQCVVCTCSRLFAEIRWDKDVVAFSLRYRGQRLLELLYGIVVIRDDLVISPLKRPHLRPAAIRKLCS